MKFVSLVLWRLGRIFFSFHVPKSRVVDAKGDFKQHPKSVFEKEQWKKCERRRRRVGGGVAGVMPNVGQSVDVSIRLIRNMSARLLEAKASMKSSSQ